MKNSDIHDQSLWQGRGYFPERDTYVQYVSQTESKKEVESLVPLFLSVSDCSFTQKSVCNYISAVNHQDRKKFRGNDETGLINVQCSHVFVLSSVDMYLGER